MVTVSLRAFAALLSGFALIVVAPVPASAAEKTITVTQAKAICKGFQATEQTGVLSIPINEMQLEGHNKTMVEECNDPNTPPPLSTITQICRSYESPEVLGASTVSMKMEGKTLAGTISASKIADDPQAVAACSKICVLSWLAVACEDVKYADAIGTAGTTVPRELNTKNVNTLGNGFAFWALLACIAGIFGSAALWAMGSKGQRPGTELAGKKGIVVCVTAAFFVGALPAWSAYLDDVSKKADPDGVHGHTVPTVFKDSDPATMLAKQRQAEIDNLTKKRDQLKTELGAYKEGSEPHNDTLEAIKDLDTQIADLQKVANQAPKPK